MMTDKLLHRFCMLAIILCIGACQQLPEDTLMEDYEESLKVEVRSADGVEIAYPLFLYAFDKNGKMVASQTVEDVDEEMSLPMAEGNYQVIAIAGVSDDYLLPENPDADDVIVMSHTKGAETPLMMGKADINISGRAEATAKLTLSHVVAALNVTLQNVPNDVSSVQLSLSPLYSSLSMNGQYGGELQKVNVECSLKSEGTWVANTCYIFPGSGKETVFSVYFKKKDGSEVTYGYTYKGVPEANKLFNVSGNYSGGVIVGGSFDVNDWEGAINVEFDFGGSGLPNQDDEDAEVDLTGVPEAGTIWNDMIVVDLGEADDTGVDLLLMTLDEWDATTSQVDDVISGYSINGLAEWRLPDYEEAKLLRARFSGDNRLELNDKIAEYDDGLYGLDGEERYLCLKNEVYYSFKFAGGSTISKAGEKRSYYVRLVKTYHFVLEE